MKKTYEIEIYGYGAEVIMGTLTDVQYDFWIPYADKESEALNSHLFWDSTSEEEGNPVTDPEDERFLGEWHELDDIVHTCAVLWDNCKVEIIDPSNGDIVWSSVDLEITKTEFYDPDDMEGKFIKAWSSEKGMFYGGEFKIDGEFDPSKLKFYASNIDCEVFVDSVEYDNEVIENDTGGETTGKGYGYLLYES